MKKTITILLAICLCIAMCACTSEKSPDTTEHTESTAPIETIDERPLLNDTDNGARAQMNIGKGTTIHGVVTEIGTTSCMIRLILPKHTSVYVEMPVEQLAKLNNNTFISIEGIVSDFNANGDGKYTIRGEKILSIEEMDTWVKARIANQYNFNCEIGGDSLTAFFGICDDYDIDLLYTYAKLSGDMYRINSDTELEEYLIGNWHCDYDKENPLMSCHFLEIGSFSLLWSQSGYWSVEDGELHMRTPSSKEVLSGPVYVFSNDIFICDGILFAKDKST